MDSLKKRIPFLLAAITLPVLFFTALTLWHSGRQMREEVIQTNRSALTFYQQELDTSLDNTQSYLLNLSVFNDDLPGMNSSDHDTRLIAQSKIFEQLKQDFEMYDVNCIFVYAPVHDSLAIIYSSPFTFSDAIALRGELKTNYEKYLTRYNWELGRIAGKSYLYQINFSTLSGPCICGALYDVDSLQSRMQDASGGISMYLTDAEGVPLTGATALYQNEVELIPGKDAYTSGKKSEIVLHTVSNNGFTLWEVFQLHVFLGNSANFFYLTILFAVLLTLLLAVASLLIYRWVLRPLGGIEEGLSRLAAGNIDYRLKLPGAVHEYRAVGNAFNSMAEQIKGLKIQVYEEQIRFQESELNFLYMQMRPHFFLNALTTVQNFAKIGQYENMYSFIGYLGQFIRYSLRHHVSGVTLDRELAHIENYVAMQNLQHPDAVFLMIDAQEETLSCIFPPFIVYTFAENCIKHALSLETPLSIFITARIQQDQLYIAVEDNSTGFPEEYLKKFSDPAWLDDPSEKHIGVRNVIKTLQLLYKDKASVRLSNATPSGARVELLLPVQRETDRQMEE